MERIFAPVPVVPRESPPAPTQPDPPKRKKNAGRKTVVVHTVNPVTFAQELGVETEHSIAQLCSILATRQVMVAMGSAPKESHVARLKNLFGSGNVLLYALLGGRDIDPQYLALGITEGCTADGLVLRGHWRVLTALGGESNAFTKMAIEHSPFTSSTCNVYDAVFKWSECYSAKPLASLLKPVFVKAYIDKPWTAYQSIVNARTENAAIPYSMQTRAMLLLELLLNFSEEAKRVFLHEVVQRG